MSARRLAVGMAVLAAGLLVGDHGVRAGTPEDDLSVVKRAVASDAVAFQAVDKDAPRPKKDGAPAQWLRVRVVEKREDGRREKRVSVNLPLGLVRALGDFPIDIGCRGRSDDGRRCPKLRISDVLDALDKGQSLVEVDADDAMVRIWIE